MKSLAYNDQSYEGAKDHVTGPMMSSEGVIQVKGTGSMLTQKKKNHLTILSKHIPILMPLIKTF